MKANELRIGNLVNTSKGIRSCIDVMCDSVSFEDIECDILDNIEPIPLTEEWLLKFGANQHGNPDNIEDMYHFKLTNNSALYVCTQEGDIQYANTGKALYLIDGAPYGSFPCKYVHQLQNLYFALTGEELTTGEPI